MAWNRYGGCVIHYTSLGGCPSHLIFSADGQMMMVTLMLMTTTTATKKTRKNMTLTKMTMTQTTKTKTKIVCLFWQFERYSEYFLINSRIFSDLVFQPQLFIRLPLSIGNSVKFNWTHVLEKVNSLFIYTVTALIVPTYISHIRWTKLWWLLHMVRNHQDGYPYIKLS